MVLWLTLNRPEKRNALSADVCRELVDVVNRGNHDMGTGAIVLAANGPAFSAGMDLEEAARVNPETSVMFTRAALYHGDADQQTRW